MNKSRKKLRRRVLFTFISLIVCFFSGVQLLWAQIDYLDPDGNKLINVTTLAQLNAIRYDVDGNGHGGGTSYGNAGGMGSLFNTVGMNTAIDYYEGYELMNDLDFSTSSWAYGISAAGWLPIASGGDSFTGIFDGNDHTISNLYVNRIDGGGLFGGVGVGAVIRNVGMVDVDITAVGSPSGGSVAYSGGLVRKNYGGMVSNSYATGTVSATFSYSRSSSSASSASYYYSGGLVGYNYRGTISNSCATVSVSTTSTSNTFSSSSSSSSYYSGGLVGYNDGGTISNSYATGAVSTTFSTSFYSSYSSYSGGLVGYNDEGTISNSYATGAVSTSYSSSYSSSSSLFWWLGGV